MPRTEGRWIVALLLVLVTAVGCKQEEKQPPSLTGPVHTVDLRMAMVFLHGAHEYELASTYINEFGTLFKLDTLRFVLSNTIVTDDDGSTVGSFPGRVLLVDASQGIDTFALGSLAAVHIHLMSWTLGLGTTTNH
ncbi:MAG: hypothetical protein ABI432_09960, partial [Flavobacteriales bacterium]